MNDRPVLVMARAHVMDRPGHVVDWIAVEDGIIRAVGEGEPPQGLVEPCAVADLRPNTIIPVLHDCHVHFLQTGLLEIDVDLGRAERFADVLELLSDAASRCDRPMLRGHSFDPDLLPKASVRWSR